MPPNKKKTINPTPEQYLAEQHQKLIQDWETMVNVIQDKSGFQCISPSFEVMSTFLTQTAKRYAELRVGEMVAECEKMRADIDPYYNDYMTGYHQALSAVIELFKK